MSANRPPYPDYQFPSKQQRRGRWWWVLLPIALLLITIAAWLILKKQSRMAEILPRIRAAIAGISGAETTSWIVSNGHRIFKERRHFSVGGWRIESADGSLRICNSAGVYELVSGHLSPTLYPVSEFGATEPRQFSFENFDPADNDCYGVFMRLGSVSSPYREGANHYLDLISPTAVSKLRVVCKVDANSYLPVTVELQEQYTPKSPWVSVGVQEAKYSAQDAALFDPAHLAATNLASGKSLGGAQNGNGNGPRPPPGSNVRATAIGPLGTSLTIHNVYLNRRGDLFITLKSPGEVEVTDQDGTPYSTDNLIRKHGPGRSLWAQNGHFSFEPPRKVYELFCTPLARPNAPKTNKHTFSVSTGSGPKAFTFGLIVLDDRSQSQVAPSFPDPFCHYPRNLPELVEEELLDRDAYYAARAKERSLAPKNPVPPQRFQHPDALETADLHEQLRCNLNLIPIMSSDPRLLDVDRLDSLSNLCEEEAAVLVRLDLFTGAQEAEFFARNLKTGMPNSPLSRGGAQSVQIAKPQPHPQQILIQSSID